MDISYVSKDQFKIKAKTGVVSVNAAQLSVAHKSGGDDFVITQPGEYEVEGISVFGYATTENTIYVVQFDDVRVLYLGNVSKPLSEKTITELENIDVVILNTDTLNNKDAAETIAKLEPYYVLPYGSGVAGFVTSYEHGSRSVKSLNLSKVALPDDLTEVIVFE